MYLAGYFLWSKDNSAFLIGGNINSEERIIEIFLGIFAIEIDY
jgi:hypothetical protein